MRGRPGGSDLAECIRDDPLTVSMSVATRALALLSPVGFAVGGDQGLVDAPGVLDFDVRVTVDVDREKPGESLGLPVGQ